MTVTTDTVEITCTPGDGILTVSAETIAALDQLARTIPEQPPWQIELLIGHTPTDTIRITARPGTDREATP